MAVPGREGRKGGRKGGKEGGREGGWRVGKRCAEQTLSTQRTHVLTPTSHLPPSLPPSHPPFQQEKSEPVAVASALVSNMQEFTEAFYLAGPARLFKVNEAAVEKLVQVWEGAREGVKEGGSVGKFPT